MIKSKNLILSILVLFTSVICVPVIATTTSLPLKPQTAEQKTSALNHLQMMQVALKEKNYEMLYFSSQQGITQPLQLIHGIINNKEVNYLSFLNGPIRETLQYDGNISYFEQGKSFYTLKTKRDLSNFNKIANYNLQSNALYYDYIILGKGRIAGKQALAIKVNAKDKYRYSYVIWIDTASSLPLRFDILNTNNLIIEQEMVASLYITETANPWLTNLINKKITIPSATEVPGQQFTKQSEWKLKWIPPGFKLLKSNMHKLKTTDKEMVSYLMITNDLSTVSIYISQQNIPLDKNKSLIYKGSLLLYSAKKGNREINIIGNIPKETAVKLANSLVISK